METINFPPVGSFDAALLAISDAQNGVHEQLFAPIDDFLVGGKFQGPVSFEDVGRLAVFLADARSYLGELERELDVLSEWVGPLGSRARHAEQERAAAAAA